MEKEKLILLHKGRSCVSLNPKKKAEIAVFINKYAHELSWKVK